MIVCATFEKSCSTPSSSALRATASSEWRNRVGSPMTSYRV